MRAARRAGGSVKAMPVTTGNEYRLEAIIAGVISSGTPAASTKFDGVAVAEKGDRHALDNRNPELVGQKAHDRGVGDPGAPFKFCPPLTQGNEKIFRPISEPKTESSSARVSWLLPMI